jgi:hypothetical protein
MATISLSGLDLSFMADWKPPKKKQPKRYPSKRVAGPAILPDISTAYKDGGFKSPIDGEFITSRSQLRAHERKHNVRQAGDFRKGELIGREKAKHEANMDFVRRHGGPISTEWV